VIKWHHLSLCVLDPWRTLLIGPFSTVKTLAFISGKGGVGKTSLTYLLGAALTQAGRRVQFLDLDPQESLSGILRIHQVPTPSDPEFRVVDTPSRLESREVREAIKTADVICIPMGPSPMDYSVTVSTAELVQKLKNPGAKACIVLNRIRKGTFWSKKFVASDAADFAVPVSNCAISLRECFAHALTSGWEALDEPASNEVLNLALSLS
jgi:chromosome partitioning protein